MATKLSLLMLALSVVAPSGHASDLYFSPEGGVRDQIIKRVNHSKETIDVAVYSFTAGEIAQSLAEAAKRGVRVRIVRDASQSGDKNDENSFLTDSGIPVHITSGRGRGIMHDKFAVFDGKEACTGSYNWTNNAEHNNWENWLCTDESKVIKGFQEEYERLWKAPAKPVLKRKAHRKPHNSLR